MIITFLVFRNHRDDAC